MTFDISDGTANDYSNDFPHHYSTGPTGFSGFQNLHEVSTASAVLDFTDITNNDTINDNTLRGLHHKLRVASDGTVENSARLFARLNETAILWTAIANQGQLITEDLYGSYLRLTRGFDVTTVSSNYSSGSTLSVADSSGFESGGGNAITGAADATNGRFSIECCECRC